MACLGAVGEKGQKIYTKLPILQCAGHFQFVEMLSSLEEGTLKDLGTAANICLTSR